MKSYGFRRGRWLFHHDQYRDQSPVFEVQRAAVRITAFLDGQDAQIEMLAGDNPADPNAVWVPWRMNGQELLLTPPVGSTQPITQIVVANAGWYRLETANLAGTNSMVWAEDQEGTLDENILPVHIVRPACGGGATPPPQIDPVLVTCAELDALATSGALEPGRTYGITDVQPLVAAGQVFYTQALSPNNYSLDGTWYIPAYTGRGGFEARIAPTPPCRVIMFYDHWGNNTVIGETSVNTFVWGGNLYHNTFINTNIGVDVDSVIDNSWFCNCQINAIESTISDVRATGTTFQLAFSSVFTSTLVGGTLFLDTGQMFSTDAIGTDFNLVFSTLAECNARPGVSLPSTVTMDYSALDGLVVFDSVVVLSYSSGWDFRAEGTSNLAVLNSAVRGVVSMDQSIVELNRCGADPYIPSKEATGIEARKGSIIQMIAGTTPQGGLINPRRLRAENESQIICTLPYAEEGWSQYERIVATNGSNINLNYCERADTIVAENGGVLQATDLGFDPFADWYQLSNVSLLNGGGLYISFDDNVSIHNTRFLSLSVENRSNLSIHGTYQTQVTDVKLHNSSIFFAANLFGPPANSYAQLRIASVTLEHARVDEYAFSKPRRDMLYLRQCSFRNSYTQIVNATGGMLVGVMMHGGALSVLNADANFSLEQVNIATASVYLDHDSANTLLYPRPTFSMREMRIGPNTIMALNDSPTAGLDLRQITCDGRAIFRAMSNSTSSLRLLGVDIASSSNVYVQLSVGANPAELLNCSFAAGPGTTAIVLSPTLGLTQVQGLDNYGYTTGVVVNYSTSYNAPYGANF